MKKINHRFDRVFFWGFIIIGVLTAILLIGLFATKVFAEGSYQESACSHYSWVEIPGSDGQPAFWQTSDPALVLTSMDSANISGRFFVVSRATYALANVQVQNTWGCYYDGSYYPSPERVSELSAGFDLCVVIDEEGQIETTAPVNGACVLPDPPQPTDTPEPTVTITETATETPVPTGTPEPTATPVPTETPQPTATLPPPNFNIGGGINTIEGWHSAAAGSSLTITTSNEYDVVPVAYSDPNAAVHIRLEVPETEELVLQKGVYVNAPVWDEGGWEADVTADGNGTMEIVVRMPYPPHLPAIQTVVFTAQYSGVVQSWTAHVSNGTYGIFLPLVTR